MSAGEAARRKSGANDGIAQEARRLGFSGDDAVPFFCECDGPCLELRPRPLADHAAARAAGTPLVLDEH